MTQRTPGAGPGRRPYAAGALTAATAALLAVAGCAGAGGSHQAARSSATATPTAPTTAPTTAPASTVQAPPVTSSPGLPSGPGRLPRPSGGRTSLPVEPTPTPPPGEVISLDGVVKRGVEPGCVVFTTDDRQTYQLLSATGGTPDASTIPFGVHLTVRAVKVDQLVSYCQQGTPLEIVDFARR